VIAHQMKWFLCLSVAAHAVVLGAWRMPAYSPGTRGHVVELSVTQRAGNAVQQSQPTPEPEAHTATDNSIATTQTPTSAGRVASNPVFSQHRTPQLADSTAERPSSTASAAMTTATAAASVPASSASLQKEETDRRLRNSVMDLISRELTYPAIARRKGWQGTVKLQLHIEADGAITRLQVDETSGYSILDSAAMECLQLASIPGADRWLRGQAIDIVVPVEYRLVDG
jgi:protein TonB